MKAAHIIRVFEPTLAEYEGIVRVYNVVNSDDPGSVESWQHWDQHRNPIKFHSRYVVEDKGQIVGYGFSVRTDPAANKFRFAVYLLPEWETAELLHQFYSFIMAHCRKHSPAGFVCSIQEDQQKQTDWLESQGFQPVMRYPSSVLLVQAFDPTPYAVLKADIAAQGIEILSLKELAERYSDWQRKVYDLEMLLSQDVPRPTVYSPPSFEQYVHREFEDPNFIPESWLVVLDSDTCVGIGSLLKSGDNFERLINGMTGVRRDYRRRGLATALKCELIEIARQLGCRYIQTYNEENNPMFQINLQLGYQPQPADVDWEKVIEK